MLARFQGVYGFAIPVADQPSDRTLSIVRHLWMKRSMEFAPLSSVASYSDQDSSWLLAPKKIAGADLLYSPGSPVKKSDLWMRSAPCFAHAVKTPIYSYALASVQDPDDQQWVNLSAALAWVGPIANLMRIGSRASDPLFARITESEALASKDWLPAAQRDPTASLSDITHVCSRTWRYPVASVFALPSAQGKARQTKVAQDHKWAFELLQKQNSDAHQNKGGGRNRKAAATRSEEVLLPTPVSSPLVGLVTI